MNKLFSTEIEINDLNLATALIKESQAGFFKLFNNSPAYMTLTTVERVYVKVNKKFLEKFEFTEEEIIGRTSAEIGILDKEESQKVAAILKEKGKLQNDLVVCRTKSGKEVQTVSSIEKIEFNGEIYLLSTFLDITKQWEAEEKLKIANKDLESFSYSVSHDLRAPLRAIYGFIQLLDEDYGTKLEEEGKRLIDIVKANAVKMERLIDDLLAFSRIGRKELQKTEVDMNVLVAGVIAELDKAAVERAEIIIENLHTVQGNYDLLHQVMVNLISNAIKYSSKKEKPVVRISSEKKNYFTTFSVKDNGAGFDMQYADKLFGVFQRLHSATEFEGTGVGLAIVHRVITNHQGKVWAEAKKDEGATFYFSLPES